MIGNIGDQLLKSLEKAVAPYQEQTADLHHTLKELNENVINLTHVIAEFNATRR